MNDFQKVVWDYFATNSRPMPWRENPSPYNVVVSEIMLQQTQVARVVPKFLQFTQLFPSFTALAKSNLGDVLRAWNGLGYNRRAKFLWQTAGLVADKPFPKTVDELVKLPGIGPNTAGAIMAYVYDQPSVFIETNIRTVFIHHFFATQSVVGDAEIRKLVAASLPKRNVRQWYWALMDYGTHLKATRGAQLEKAKTYTKQSAFNGSRRQVRGAVIRTLGQGDQNHDQLAKKINDARLPGVLADLLAEGLIQKTEAGTFRI